MIELIKEKLKELKENFPQNPEFRSWMQQSDQWSWVYSILRIRGEKVHKTAVVNMIQGSISEDLTLSAYILADHFRTVYQDMIGYIGMSTDLEQKMVLRWAKMILDLDPSVPDSSVFRQNRNVIYEWDLIPEPEEKVPELFSQLLKEYKKEQIAATQKRTTAIDSRFIFMKRRKFSAFDSVCILLPKPPVIEE